MSWVGNLYTSCRFQTWGGLGARSRRSLSVVERGGYPEHLFVFVGYPQPVDNCPRFVRLCALVRGFTTRATTRLAATE